MDSYRDTIFKEDWMENYNPFDISGVKESIEIIDALMKKDSNVLICAPSSLDGVLSTSILLLTLRYLKLNVNYYIVDDNEDINIDEMKNHIELMKSETIFCLGKFVKTDSLIQNVFITNKAHDLYDEGDYVLINPHKCNTSSSFKELTLPSLIYKIVQAISKFYNLRSIMKFIDIVFISLFNDNVKMSGENYELLKEGAYFLKHTKNYGLMELISLNKCNLSINQLINFLDPQFINKDKITNSRLIVELLTVSNPLKANQISKYLIKQVNGKMEERI